MRFHNSYNFLKIKFCKLLEFKKKMVWVTVSYYNSVDINKGSTNNCKHLFKSDNEEVDKESICNHLIGSSGWWASQGPKLENATNYLWSNSEMQKDYYS